MTTCRRLALLLGVWVFLAHSHAEIFNAQGEIAGEPTQTSILLQTRLTAISGPATNEDGDIPGAAGVARFEFGTNPNFKTTFLTPLLRADPEHDFIVRARLEGLEAGTTYVYRLLYGESETDLKKGPPRSFRTLPDPAADAAISFVMGSCQNYAFFMRGIRGDGVGAAPEADRSEGYPSYAAMLALHPDFFVGTGDIVYYDHPAKTAARTLEELR